MRVDQPPRGVRARQRLAVLLGVVLAVGMHHALAAVDAVLVLDNSGSMRKNDPQFLTRLAAQRFIERIGDDARVAVLAFDEEARWLRPLTTLDAESQAELLASLDSLDYAGRLTDSAGALERAIYELRTNARVDADRAIIFLTDGIVDTGDKARDADKARWIREDLSLEAAASGIRIFGIAFTEGADFEMIQALSLRTDGAYYRAFSAGDVDGVFRDVVDALAPAAPAQADLSVPDAAPVLAEPELPAGVESLVARAPVAAVEAPDPSANAAAAMREASRAADPLVANPISAGPISAETIPADSGPADRGPVDPVPAGPVSDSPVSAGTGPAPDAPSGPLAAAPTSPRSVEPVVAAAAPAPPLAAPPSFRAPPAALVGAGVAALALLAAAALTLRRRRLAVAEVAPPVTPKAFLNDIDGITGQSSFELGAKLTVVGRIAGQHPDEINYIVIEEATIGRQHALIEFRDHSFWIVDQNSINGTFVNRRRLEGEARLKHGDRVRFHRHEFEFLVLEMFETDRTMLSQTVLERRAAKIVESPERGEASVA